MVQGVVTYYHAYISNNKEMMGRSYKWLNAEKLICIEYFQFSWLSPKQAF